MQPSRLFTAVSTALLALCLSLPPRAAAAAPLTKLIVQVGTLAAAPTLADIYVAQKAGFFEEEGLDVELRYSANASQSAQLAASGASDIGRLSWEPLLLGYDKGLRGKIIYTFYTRFMYFTAVPQDSPIRTIADLRGKQIAITNLGSASIIVLHSMLRSVGLGPNDVSLVPAGVGPTAMNLLNQKRVDALMLYDSYYSAVEAAGTPLRYIYHPEVEYFGNSGYFSTQKTIDAKGDALGHFGRAIAKATTFIFANPEAAVRIYWQVNPAGKIGASEEAAMERTLAELKGDMRDFDPANAPGGKFGAADMERFKIYMAMMVREGGMPKAVPVEDFVTTQFIPMANDFDVEKVRAQARAWKPKT